ncbi:MAG TPA: response regulator transcription factor [Terriglobales bacterium]|nr:response regulator transcription factor [Terriglobales bacterium]
MSTFRILVVDDHPVFRLGLGSLLASHPDWELCGESADGRDAVEKCMQLKPDLVILDICMPLLNGVEAARQILNHDPNLRILVVTDVASEQVIRECLEIGVRGWFFKSDTTQDLVTAVEALQGGRSMFSAGVSDLILNGYVSRDQAVPPVIKLSQLSLREREVIQLVGEGNSSREVARLLGISLKTAETHRSNIMRKLKLHSLASLVLYAVTNEIIHVPLPGVSRFTGSANGREDVATGL